MYSNRVNCSVVAPLGEPHYAAAWCAFAVNTVLWALYGGGPQKSFLGYTMLLKLSWMCHTDAVTSFDYQHGDQLLSPQSPRASFWKLQHMQSLLTVDRSPCSVSMAHVTVACPTAWHIRVRKSMAPWEYRAQSAQSPVPLPVKHVTLLQHGGQSWMLAHVNLQWTICKRGKSKRRFFICCIFGSNNLGYVKSFFVHSVSRDTSPLFHVTGDMFRIDRYRPVGSRSGSARNYRRKMFKTTSCLGLKHLMCSHISGCHLKRGI